jgi:hypothetical protein
MSIDQMTFGQRGNKLLANLAVNVVTICIAILFKYYVDQMSVDQMTFGTHENKTLFILAVNVMTICKGVSCKYCVDLMSVKHMTWSWRYQQATGSTKCLSAKCFSTERHVME